MTYNAAMKRKAKKTRRPLRPVYYALAALLFVAAGYLFCPASPFPALPSLAREGWGQARAWVFTEKNSAPAAPQTAARGAADAIQVYFAPAASMDPWAIDKQIVQFIRSAQRSIDCACYDLQLMAVAEALIERRRAGVAVRLVSDSHYESRPAVQACIEAGIPVVFDQRSAFMHNKFCVADGAQVWTGSTNLTENCMYRNNNNAVWIVSLELAANFTAEFKEMFLDKKFGARSPSNTPHPILMVDGIVIENYFAPEDGVRREILSEIRDARQRIDFMVFAFTCQDTAQALAARMAEGVKVRGLIEARNAGSKHSQHRFLEKHGAEIHLDKNTFNMHHKVMILDKKTVITGSYNFSKNADTQNDENVVIIHDPATAEAYMKEMDALL